MYQYQPMNGLGFSLKLPSWLTQGVKGIAGALIRGTTVTIPTPVGPQSFDLGDPASMAQLKAMLTGSKLAYSTTRPETPMDRFSRGVEQHVPGGWFTLIGVGVGAFLLMSMMRPRRS